jgi:dTMP kinase
MSTIIVIEGLDGTGKTTVAKALAEALVHRGDTARYVREPGTTPVGERIRDEFLLSKVPMHPASLFYLFQVARAEMLQSLAEDADRPAYIVMDRFWPSTLAYQVYASGIPRELFESSQLIVKDLVKAIGSEIDICLTVPEEIRQYRMQMSGKGGDRYESKPKEFTDRVRQAYEDMVALRLVHAVDASVSVETVVNHIMSDFIDT